jgi:acyl-CoA thioesterase YciA
MSGAGGGGEDDHKNRRAPKTKGDCLAAAALVTLTGSQPGANGVSCCPACRRCSLGAQVDGCAAESKTKGKPFKHNQARPFLDNCPMTHEEMHASAHAPTALPADKELALRVIPMPSDANFNGDIFGGWIMAQVDLAGSVLPVRIAKGRVTTVAVNQFIFKQPVSVGDLLSFYATVERIGNTSITVRVEVYAERNPADIQVVKVTEANLTYVAIDKDGKPRQIPR